MSDYCACGRELEECCDCCKPFTPAAQGESSKSSAGGTGNRSGAEQPNRNPPAQGSGSSAPNPAEDPPRPGEGCEACRTMVWPGVSCPPNRQGLSYQIHAAVASKLAEKNALLARVEGERKILHDESHRQRERIAVLEGLVREALDHMHSLPDEDCDFCHEWASRCEAALNAERRGG